MELHILPLANDRRAVRGKRQRRGQSEVGRNLRASLGQILDNGLRTQVRRPDIPDKGFGPGAEELVPLKPITFP